MVLSASGIVVTGTHAQCGKTVACSGLTAVLWQLGFKVQPVKPFVFAEIETVCTNRDGDYFKQVMPYELPCMSTVIHQTPWQLSEKEWQLLIRQCKNNAYPFLLETPGSLASGIQYTQSVMKDATDLAAQLEVPLLLVTTKTADLPARLIPALSYCQQKSVSLAGWIAVETEPCLPPYWDEELAYLRYHHNIPFLGTIEYSPSISVPILQQGNIVRQTEMGVDLLPLQQSLNLTIPGFVN